MAGIIRRLLSYSSPMRTRASTSTLSKISNFIISHQKYSTNLPSPPPSIPIPIPKLCKVDNFDTIVRRNEDEIENTPLAHDDGNHHWLVYLPRSGLEFATEEELLDFYIKILATALGSEKEAKERIYLVSVARPFGFCAQFDAQTKNELQRHHLIGEILPDFSYKTLDEVRSDARFTTQNWNRRFDNIFSYHHLSKRNLNWKNDHWLINTKEPDHGFSDNNEIFRHYIKLLAEVLGSEEEARDQIYIVWLSSPFGFGAEIDLETSKKLKGRPDVLNVLPDYAFDVNWDGDGETLIIDPLSHGATFHNYCPSTYKDDSEQLNNIEKQIGVSGFSTYSGLKNVTSGGVTGIEKQIGVSAFSTYSGLENDLSGSCLPECDQNIDCEHWFVSIENPVDESASMQQRIDTYIKTLAMVIGSEKAKESIYRIKYQNHINGFAAKMDVHTSNKLKAVPGVVAVVPDYLCSRSYQYNFAAIDGMREMKVNLKSWKLTHADAGRLG